MEATKTEIEYKGADDWNQRDAKRILDNKEKTTSRSG
jgi:hypothetical protein